MSIKKDAIETLKRLAEKAHMCMFVTRLSELPLTSRPMSLKQCDEDGDLWFVSSDISHKNKEIEKDNRVQLFFINNTDLQYLSVYGRATIYHDKATIDDKWKQARTRWFDGKDDPNITVIRVTPERMDYWDAKSRKMGETVCFSGE